MDPYPTDREGFAVHSRDLVSDMRRYNLVVIPMLDEVEQRSTIQEFWRLAPRVDPDNVETWGNANWPNPNHPFLITDYAEDFEAFKNRVHPNLIDAYTKLHGSQAHLMSTIDVYGIKRPTIGHPEWRLAPLKLHWDVDVFEYKHPRYQALCALNEHNKSVGCFAYVPQSATRLNEWLKKYAKNLKNTPKYVPNPNPLQQQVVPLPLRAGSTVIWDMGVAHSNTSNFSTLPRLTQFCRMIPVTEAALKNEKQALAHWWKEHPDKREIVRNMHSWSPIETKILNL